MMKHESCEDLSVRLDEESPLARFAEWEARSKGCAVAALGTSANHATYFLPNEVLVDSTDTDLIDILVRDHGAEVIPDEPIPDAPEPLRRARHREFDIDEMPRAERLLFRQAPRIERPERAIEGALAQGGATGGSWSISSSFGTSTAALVAQHASERQSIGLNVIADNFAMPLSTATEGAGAGSNPFLLPEYSGRTRMVEAWQLIDSVRLMSGSQFITIGILDGGFWVDGAGVPFVAAGQSASDFGTGVMQLNLMAEGQPVGGTNPNRCTGGTACPWHGNGVASAAAATVNNAAGAAGSGGTVALPFLFKSSLSVDQILRCVRICTAWGIDVLNMSFGFSAGSELFFGTSAWNRTFQFASDNRVVMIAAAGNSALNLPDDDNVRPATRTPGVLTVGALDQSDNARARSNFGSSVWLWAPGTSVQVAPDGNNPNGSAVNGTSIAAPIVSGVAAMMRFANAALSAADIRRILVETGWVGSGRVSRGLDAYAAVLAAINQTLPDRNEPNNTPQTASELVPTGPGKALVPILGPFSTLSVAGDRDYWRFKLNQMSTVNVEADWYDRLSTLNLAVESDDPDARGPHEMVRSGSGQSGRQVLSGLLAPGTYRVRVTGKGGTAYRLLVRVAVARLPKDQFEDNDSFERAARLLFETSKWSVYMARSWGPGTYEASLHQDRGFPVALNMPPRWVMNDDYFRLEVPSSSVFRQPKVSVFDADVPVTVTLFDATRQVIQSWPNVRRMSVKPPPDSTCYLKVTGSEPTRYFVSTGLFADPRNVPGPLQEELEVIPKWWGDPPPFRIRQAVETFIYELDGDAGEPLTFEPLTPDVRLELVDQTGALMRQAEERDGLSVIDTRGIDAGQYLLRVTRNVADPQAGMPALKLAPPIH